MSKEGAMSPRFLVAAVSILCSAFFFVGQPQAADLTFFIGGVNPGTINIDDVKTALDGGPIFGFRLANNFVPAFGMEHTLAFSSDYLFPRSVSSIKEARGFVYNSNLILNIPAGKLVPYLTAGVGVVHQYGDRDMPVGTRFAYNYGGGVKLLRLAGPMGLRLDIRGYRIGAFSNQLNLLEISGGVMLSLGK